MNAVRAAGAFIVAELIDALASRRRYGIIAPLIVLPTLIALIHYVVPLVPLPVAWIVSTGASIYAVLVGMMIIADLIVIARRCRLSKEDDR